MATNTEKLTEAISLVRGIVASMVINQPAENAQAALDLLQRLEGLRRQPGLDTLAEGLSATEKRDLLNSPDKGEVRIATIKAVRERTGAGLAESKDAVDAFIRGTNGVVS